MTNARRWVALHRRCPPRSPPPSFPPPAPLCTGRPTCMATPFVSPLCHAHSPPHPVSPFPLPPPPPPCPASPSPLRACRGHRRDSAPPPSFPFAGSSPLYPGCTPPRLYALRPLCT